VGLDTSALRAWMVNRPGGRRPLETGWARKRWDSSSPPSAGHDPAGRRGRSDKALAARFDSEVANWPVAQKEGRGFKSRPANHGKEGTMMTKQALHRISAGR
jgi:hypothetical protein